jgi:hypothetical protein
MRVPPSALAVRMTARTPGGIGVDGRCASGSAPLAASADAGLERSTPASACKRVAMSRSSWSRGASFSSNQSPPAPPPACSQGRYWSMSRSSAGLSAGLSAASDAMACWISASRSFSC